MSKQVEQITPDLANWILQQKIFFVATAPLSENGHVNCSPKGGDAFKVLGPLSVAGWIGLARNPVSMRLLTTSTVVA